MSYFGRGLFLVPLIALSSALGVSVSSTAYADSPVTSASPSQTSDTLPADGTESPLPTGRGIGNVAHKGASTNAPEDTLAAIKQAIAEGADFVGIDVHRTKDNQLVVLHDPTLARTTNVEEVFPGRAPW